LDAKVDDVLLALGMFPKCIEEVDAALNDPALEDCPYRTLYE
jgi:hypothetical protein